MGAAKEEQAKAEATHLRTAAETQPSISAEEEDNVKTACEASIKTIRKYRTKLAEQLKHNREVIQKNTQETHASPSSTEQLQSAQKRYAI
ncbi:unnamed protein product, partial [Anisakis simplex]|uniref:V-type proton ATPase subunit G n=1 Tax=Anisakis simplex TaxID=6269 RepID=A0A0M3JG80_ANISI